MKIKTELTHLVVITTLLSASLAYSDPVIINNNVAPAQASAQSQSPCPNANQNDIYDSRVPPAGAYKINHGDGSSEDLYTTGEKKPYITDNNCNANNQVQPYVWAQPSHVRR